MRSNPRPRQRAAVLAWISLLASLLAGPASAATQDVRLLDRQGRPFPPGARVIPVDPADRATPPPARGARDLPMNTVARIYPTNADAITFGDTNHDGANEAILYVEQGDYTFHYRILEEHGNNVYSDMYSGPELIPYATGDFDGDGKSDLVGQDGYRIYVYESRDHLSFPSQLVWSSPDLMNIVGFTATGDTDGDGRMELIHSGNPFSGWSKLYIFENTGDNAYTMVYSTNVGFDDNNGPKVIADLDGDGHTDIAFSGLLGRVYIYTNTGNNSWRLAWTYDTGMTNAYGCVGGIDTNGNGKPELFITGIGDVAWTTYVFEATGPNQYAPVAVLEQNDGYLGVGVNALGELDGVPPAEFMMQGNNHFWVYRSPGGGAGWDLIAEIPDSTGGGHVSLQTYDVNKNGRDEVFWLSDGLINSPTKTLVLESPVNPAGLAPQRLVAPPALAIFPNPCSSRASLTAPFETGRITILDLAGRVVARQAWRRTDPVLRTDGLAAGVFWLRMSDAAGSATATGRFVVSR